MLLLVLLVATAALGNASALRTPAGYVESSLHAVLLRGSETSSEKTLEKSPDMSAFMCGSVVPVQLAVQVPESGELQLEISFDAASDKAPGAAFSDCMAAYASVDGVRLGLVQSKSGDVFAAGSKLLCSVSASALQPGAKLGITVEARFACMSGSKPAGQLRVALGNDELLFRNVENAKGAHSSYLTLQKTITTGDGLCGIHDGPVLVDSYLVNDKRQVKFCYKIVNHGTQTACGVRISQHDGLDGGVNTDVSIPALSDDCSLGRFDAIPGSTTTGLSAYAWSFASAELLVDYPCGVTKLEPRATLQYAGGEQVRRSVAINTMNDCTGDVRRMRPALDKLGLDRQATMDTCYCKKIASRFYYLQYVQDVNYANGSPTGFSLCNVLTANDGWQCLEYTPSLSEDVEICIIDVQSRYVPTNGISAADFSSIAGTQIGCQTRDVQIITPIFVSRFSEFH